MSWTTVGCTLAHTEMTPEPPSDMIGTTMSSLPLKSLKVGETYLATLVA